MNKAEAKIKRQELLDQIHQLEKERCAVCSESGQKPGIHNCKCTAAVKIRKLGTEYLNIATKAREGRLKLLVRETKKRGLTVERYFALKEAGLIDKEIYQALRMNVTKFYEWKYNNGLRQRPVPQGKRTESNSAKREKKAI